METNQDSIQILMIEDNPGDVLLTREIFAEINSNIRLTNMADGMEALAYLQGEPPYENVIAPDLILLDLNMPRMDGRELLRCIKEHPALRAIPVIVLSTSSANTDIAACYTMQASAFITKPVDFEQFQEVITRINDFWIGTAHLPSVIATSEQYFT